MELREIGRDVFACLQEDRGLGCSNSGLLNRGGGLVVDTFWDLPHTREMIALYGRVWREPARRVLNTHENGDHCWGNQLFQGAEILASQATARDFGKHENPALFEMLRHQTSSADPGLAALARALAAWDFSGIEITPPTRTFDGELVLDLDGLAVRLLVVGPAHTAGDVIVHLPEQRVVFAGDVLFRLCTPIGWAGTFAGWTAALDTIVALAPEVVVPGHGPVCGPEGPREMKDYLVYVRAESKRGFEAGWSAFETARRIDLGPYASWTEPERILANVERAYRELRGEPFDAPIDTGALFGGIQELRAQRAAAADGAT